jgi:uncharacterized membrane protein
VTCPPTFGPLSGQTGACEDWRLLGRLWTNLGPVGELKLGNQHPLAAIHQTRQNWVRLVAPEERRVAIMTLFLSCFLLGFLTGLRSLTAPAAVCWAAHFGWLNLAGTKLAFISHPAVLVIVTALALGELVADKLPKTPARTAPLGLIARIVFGAFCGVTVAASTGGSLLVAAIVAVVGALIGTFGGYNVRRALGLRTHLPDFAVALAEDVIAVAGSLLIVSRI